MSNSFLFIIPLTPFAHLTDNRKILRKLCLNAIVKQTYSNWKVILVGEAEGMEMNHEKFIQLNFEGAKEEKLQKATSFILENAVKADYIIRLDDDDVFNPDILSLLAETSFDLFVDKYHSFWNIKTGLVSQKVMYWFPNTCIHKYEHAMTTFGTFPAGNYSRYREEPLLIENEHNDFNLFYNRGHKILYSVKSNPVYLRVLNSDSITSLQAGNFADYLNKHGYWHINDMPAFKFLKNCKIDDNLNSSDLKQGLIFRIKAGVQNIRTLFKYESIVIARGK